MNGINYPQLLKDLYDAVSHYKFVRKQLGGEQQIIRAWHNVEVELQKLREIFNEKSSRR